MKIIITFKLFQDRWLIRNKNETKTSSFDWYFPRYEDYLIIIVLLIREKSCPMKYTARSDVVPSV